MTRNLVNETSKSVRKTLLYCAGLTQFRCEYCWVSTGRIMSYPWKELKNSYQIDIDDNQVRNKHLEWFAKISAIKSLANQVTLKKNLERLYCSPTAFFYIKNTFKKIIQHFWSDVMSQEDIDIYKISYKYSNKRGCSNTKDFLSLFLSWYHLKWQELFNVW